MTQPPRGYLRWAGASRERAITEGNAAKGASMAGSGETLPTTKGLSFFKAREIDAVERVFNIAQSARALLAGDILLITKES
jgi:hypothetical protein